MCCNYFRPNHRDRLSIQLTDNSSKRQTSRNKPYYPYTPYLQDTYKTHSTHSHYIHTSSGYGAGPGRTGIYITTHTYASQTSRQATQSHCTHVLYIHTVAYHGMFADPIEPFRPFHCMPPAFRHLWESHGRGKSLPDGLDSRERGPRSDCVVRTYIHTYLAYWASGATCWYAMPSANVRTWQYVCPLHSRQTPAGDSTSATFDTKVCAKRAQRPRTRTRQPDRYPETVSSLAVRWIRARCV